MPTNALDDATAKLIAGLEAGLGRAATEEEQYHFLLFCRDLLSVCHMISAVERGEMVPKYNPQSNSYVFERK